MHFLSHTAYLRSCGLMMFDHCWQTQLGGADLFRLVLACVRACAPLSAAAALSGLTPISSLAMISPGRASSSCGGAAGGSSSGRAADDAPAKADCVSAVKRSKKGDAGLVLVVSKRYSTMSCVSLPGTG